MSPPARIALLHYTAQPVVGGVETVVDRHARLMADDGYAVTIVAGRGQSGDERIRFARLPLADSRDARIREVRQVLDRGDLPAAFDGLVGDVAAGLADAIGDADLLIAHNIASLHMNLALSVAVQRLAARPGSPRVLLWHHDVAAAMDAYRGELHPGWPWDVVRSAWPTTTSVAISESRAATYAAVTGIDRDQVLVIPDGIDPAETLGLHRTTSRFVVDRDILGAAPILLAPVRLNPRKNIELAIDILGALRESWPTAALVVTGAHDPHDPSSRAYLQRLHGQAASRGVGDAFHVVSEWLDGPPTRRLVTDLYRIADGLLLPSRDEGFGLPILEASLHRLPVFCTDIPALRDLAGASAVLFAADDPPAETAARIGDRLAADPAYAVAVRSRTEYEWRAIYRTAIGPLLERLLSGGTDE